MADITLEPMTPTDAASVALLIRTAFAAQSVITDPPPSALRVTEGDVLGHLQTGGGAVVKVAGEVAGSALWAEQDGGLYLGRLAVAVQFRGRGIAKVLIAAAETAARATRLPRIQLSTRLVLLANRCLFASCGFVETALGTHPGYAEPTFVNMEKRLAG